MKLAWMREDIASARRATTFLVVLLVGSMLLNLVLAVFAMRLAGHERVVVLSLDKRHDHARADPLDPKTAGHQRGRKARRRRLLEDDLRARLDVDDGDLERKRRLLGKGARGGSERAEKREAEGRASQARR